MLKMVSESFILALLLFLGLFRKISRWVPSFLSAVSQPSPWLLFKLPNSWGQLRDKVFGGPPYDDLYGKAPPERGTFIRLQVYEKVCISSLELFKRVGKSNISVCKNAQQG